MDIILQAIKNYKVKSINIRGNDNNNEINEINKKIKKIYVINLIEDEIKRNYIITLMKKYNLNFTLVIVQKVSNELYTSFSENSNPPSTFISKNELGCCLSHLWCLSQIIINNYENAIIFEDDIILHKNFENDFMTIYNNCTKNNQKLDFMLLGAHDFNFSNQNYKYIKNNVYKPKEDSNNLLYGAHANYYSLKGAKAMFKIRTSIISFFDKEYMLMFTHFNESSYICYPNLVISNISMSALNHNHEILSKREYDYYNKCFINFNFSNYNFIYINLLNKNILEEIIQATQAVVQGVSCQPNSQQFIQIYEYFIDKCLQENFKDDVSKINLVKKRFVMNFFNMEDIKLIFQ